MTVKQRWQLQRPGSSSGYAGDNSEGWENVRLVWAEQVQINASESDHGGGQSDKYQLMLKMHYIDGLSNGMRFVRGGRILSVDYFYDRFDDRRYLMVRCTEVR